jgi:Flp pilus assembly protein TadD
MAGGALRRGSFLRRGILAVAAAFAIGAAGCGRAPGLVKNDPATRAQALIDSGNEAFRSGDYRLAAQRYAAAASVRKDDPAAYFGLGMALTRLGRDEDARAAYAHARALAREQRAAPPP